MTNLSDEAKAIAGGLFGLGDSKFQLTFGMRESRPTARTQAALDELVAAGIIKRSKLNRHAGVKYVPLVDMTPYLKWLDRNRNNPKVAFPIVEPIPAEEPR